MFTNLGKFIGSLASKLISSLKRFPQAILMAAALVVIGIIINHNGHNFSKDTLEMLGRLAMIFALGIPLFLCVNTFFERKTEFKVPVVIGVNLTALIFQCIYYFTLLKETSFINISIYVAISFSLYLLFLIIPQLKNKDTYELYVISLLYRFVITYFYSMILYGGISAILFTIDRLFNMNIQGEIYADMFYITAGIFAPIFYLGDIPQSDERIEIEKYPKVFKVLLLYIVVPIISVYSFILYVYFITRIFAFNLPNNRIGNLVLWYGIIGTAVTFFVYPLREKNKVAKYFTTIFPKAIIPLLLLLFVAIFIRISNYGITEQRYYVVVAALWITGSMVYMALRKKAVNINILKALSIIFIVAVVGPWSAFSLSEASQLGRLEQAFSQYDMIKDGKVVKAEKEVAKEDRQNISSILMYFDNTDRLDKVKYLPDKFQLTQMNSVLGFEMAYSEFYGENDYFSYSINEGSSVVDIRGYDYYIDVSGMVKEPTNVNYTEGDFEVNYSVAKKLMEIKIGSDTVYTKDITEVVENIRKNNNPNAMLSREDMSFVEENDKIQIRYEFYNINGYMESGSDDVRVDWIQFRAFVKLKTENGQ